MNAIAAKLSAYMVGNYVEMSLSMPPCQVEGIEYCSYSRGVTGLTGQPRWYGNEMRMENAALQGWR